MKPEVKRIFTKLAKSKLEKIQLASINDLDEALSDLEFFIKNVKPEIINGLKLEKDIDILLNEAKSTIKNFTTLEARADKFINNGLKTRNKVEDELKALGISSSNVPMLNQLMKAIGDATTAQNMLQDGIDDLKRKM
jgi:hypothetical protein